VTASINSPRAREQRAANYRKEASALLKAEANLARNPNDAAAKAAVERAGVFLGLAESALRLCGDPLPQSVPAPSAPARAPTPAVSACKPVPAGSGPLTLGTAEAVVAAVKGETARSLAILAEAESLGIDREHVDAALASSMTAEQFVERHAPGEALARQIIAASEAAA
jgi:hypothetical protein